MNHRAAWQRYALIALSILLAFAFLGSRGLWDPDEGRYTNVAVNMLDSGDWLNPHRSGHVGHWTKPPLTYWAIASSLGAFGKTPFAARVPVALSYLVCVLLTWRIAKRLAPGTESTAALVFATMLLPFGASHLVTTDFILAASETLAVWAFVEARSGSRQPLAWFALMWVGFALAFLAKGPPGLLPLVVLLAYDHRSWRRHLGFQLAGAALFCTLALPWYAAVIAGNPGLFEYFIGDEVINRVTTDEFGRHGEWYGWITVYVPTLVLGTVPWTATAWRWAKGLPADIRRWRSRDARRGDKAAVFLALWVLVPLLVFILSRSRMPLYLLPLFVPLAIIIAIQRRKEQRASPRWSWLAGWVLALLGLSLATAFWPTHKDASRWAMAIRERTDTPVTEVVFVEDMARYGLRLHLDAEIEKISLDPVPAGLQAHFNPRNDEDLATELIEAVNEPGAVWICKEARWPEIQARIAALGHTTTVLGSPYRGRIIFRTRAAPEPASPPATGMPER